ncbi:PH domain-containing protein, partial [Clostridium tarantellae]
TNMILTKDYLTYNEGAFIKDKIIIPIKNISLIELEKNILYRIFRIRKIKIDSLSTTKNTEIIMILKVNDLKKLYDQLSIRIKELIHDESHNIDKLLQYKTSALDLLLLSTLRNNIILGIGLLYSCIHFMNYIYSGINEDLKRVFINIIKENIISKSTILALILSITLFFAIMLLILMMFSIIAILFKYYKFRIYRKNNYLKVEYGFLTRRSYSLAVKNIHAIKIEQNLLTQLLDLRTIKCAVVGYGDSVNEDEVIFPLCNKKIFNEFLIDIIPEFQYEGEVYKPGFSQLTRFYTIPVGTAIFICIIISIIWKDLWIIHLFIPIIILDRTFWYKNTELGFNNNLYYISYKGFNRRRLIIRRKSVEQIEMLSNPLQRRKNVCTYRLKFYSQKRSNIIRVKHLNKFIYDKILESINIEEKIENKIINE